MSTILVLLLLLSIATLASRPAALSGLLDRLLTPLLIMLGIGCAPGGLALLSSSLVESLEPALAVGVTWLGILIGLRSASREASRQAGRADQGRQGRGPAPRAPCAPGLARVMTPGSPSRSISGDAG